MPTFPLITPNNTARPSGRSNSVPLRSSKWTGRTG